MPAQDTIRGFSCNSLAGSSTISRQFFVLPSWITGQDLDSAIRVDCTDNHKTFLGFREVLQAKGGSSSQHRQLVDEWGSDLVSTLTLPLAQILQHHSSPIRVYDKFMCRQVFQEPRNDEDGGKNRCLL